MCLILLTFKVSNIGEYNNDAMDRIITMDLK